MVVGAGHAGDEVVVGEPGQLGAGSQDPHAVHDPVVGRVGMVQRHDDDLVAGPGDGPGQPVGVSGDAAHHERRVLPRQPRRCARRANVAAARWEPPWPLLLESAAVPAPPISLRSVRSTSTSSARATIGGCGRRSAPTCGRRPAAGASVRGVGAERPERGRRGRLEPLAHRDRPPDAPGWVRAVGRRGARGRGRRSVQVRGGGPSMVRCGSRPIPWPASASTRRRRPAS